MVTILVQSVFAHDTKIVFLYSFKFETFGYDGIYQEQLTIATVKDDSQGHAELQYERT